MKLVGRAAKIQESLLADAEQILAAAGEGGELRSRQIRALAGSVARHLAVLEAVIDQRAPI